MKIRSRDTFEAFQWFKHGDGPEGVVKKTTIIHYDTQDWHVEKVPDFPAGLVESMANDITWAYTEGVTHMAEFGRSLCLVPWAYVDLQHLHHKRQERLRDIWALGEQEYHKMHSTKPATGTDRGGAE